MESGITRSCRTFNGSRDWPPWCIVVTQRRSLETLVCNTTAAPKVPNNLVIYVRIHDPWVPTNDLMGICL